MNFTAEQKSQLAKLMATENLTVQHQKISTARFDPQNRVLYLPIWQNMTGVIYDLLCGHEVGHALYTPASGWHDAVVDKSKPQNYKSFLNVVEDARIEKKVKRKYPGLATAFKLAYQELSVRDFFGIKGRDVNTLPFVDRLNLFSKSQWTATWINFSAQEEVMVKKAQAVETWEDVVKLTDEIYAYSKDEQMEMRMSDFESFDYLEDGSGDYDMDTDFDLDDEEDDDGEESDIESKSGDNGKESNEKPDENNDGDANGEATDKQESKSGKQEKDGNAVDGKEKDGSKFDSYKDSNESWEDQFAPNCETDDSFRQNESMLLDEKCKEYEYVNIPKPILKNIITPANRVHDLFTEFYNKAVTEKWMPPNKATELLNEFKRKNERYIGLLAKEFEMRKAAKSFSKSKLSDTGDIDINKLSTYKFDDNIFRKVMMTPKGKNHGLVLLLDKSGSMSDNMAGSIEQILVLSMFCRKVNIPFIVYGFGDCGATHMIDINKHGVNYTNEYYKCFEEAEGLIDFGTVRLREYLNSQMTNAEFTRALKNMLLVKESYEGGRYRRTDVPRADTESLSNTPMTQALVATAEVMKNFKRKHNLDLCSLVLVHDGDADRANVSFKYETYTDHSGKVVTKLRRYTFGYSDKNYFVVDKANKYQEKLGTTYQAMNELILDWFRKVTGAKVFGFFIVNSQSRGYTKNALQSKFVFEDGLTLQDIHNKNYYEWDAKTKEIQKRFKSEKFLISHSKGFNSFFLISGGEDLKTEEDELEIDGKYTTKKLASAFAKMNKKKAVNRVLVSKFIQGIAA